MIGIIITAFNTGIPIIMAVSGSVAMVVQVTRL